MKNGKSGKKNGSAKSGKTVADELRQVFSKKPPQRCPIKDRPRKGAPLFDVPPQFHGLIEYYAKVKRKLNGNTRGMSSFWHRERVLAIEFILTDSIRVAGKHGIANINLCRDWQYTADRIA